MKANYVPGNFPVFVFNLVIDGRRCLCLCLAKLGVGVLVSKKNVFLFANMETQSGLKTEIIEDRVGKNAITLLQHYCTLHRTRTEAEWRECIALGKVTVDCVVAYNPELKLQPDTILQFINKSSSKEVIVREGGYLFHFIPNPFFLFSLFTFPQKIKIFGNE